MNHRYLIAAGSAAIAIVTMSIAGARLAGQAPSSSSPFAVPKSTYTPPKLPWGDPDLQGTYENRDNVPMERPVELGLKKTYTDEEMAARGRGRGGGAAGCAQNPGSAECQAAAVNQLDNVGGYNGFWGETHRGVRDNRTSQIEDPPDGRMPPLTPEARTVREAYLKERGPIAQDTGRDDSFGRVSVYRHWLDFDILGRCIAAQVPTGQMPYNAAKTIMQAPGWVLIVQERLNTRLISLDGRPHLGQNIRTWQGDSRGHWEGNTLVVETTNYTNKQSGGGVGSSVPPGIPFGNFRVTEHFVPVSSDRIDYYATFEDPKTWTRPWTFMLPWEKDLLVADVSSGGKPEPYVMFEYACREGDSGIANSLRGTQVALAQAAKRAALPASALSSSLLGGTEATVQARLGKPEAVNGPRWEYRTTTIGDVLFVYFVGGKVTSVRPSDLPLDQVARTP
jgi:hypothetical protein